MNGLERRKAILSLISGEGSYTVGELARALAVSKMTIHRDLEMLDQQGLVKKIYGGATAQDIEANRSASEVKKISHNHTTVQTESKDCLMCFRPVTPHLLYSLTLADGSQHFACCPHCGLWAHLLKKDQVSMITTTDFLSGRPHPAQNSFFLIKSEISPCCQPSILTFDDKGLAARFQTGFGGIITGMADALDFLRSEMTLDRGGPDCPRCSGT